MKKISAIILVLCTFVCHLASCNKNNDDGAYEKNTWYTADMLDRCLVNELPEISGTDYLRGNRAVFAKMSDEQFDSYANEVFEYLKERGGEHFGTRGEWVNSFLAYHVYRIKAVDALEECVLEEYDDSLNELTYIFVYSDGAVDEDGNVIFNIIRIEKSKEEGTVKNGDEVFKCNMKITIYHEKEPNVGYSIN